MTPDYETIIKSFSEETKQIVGIDDRFSSAPQPVQQMRVDFGVSVDYLIKARDAYGRGPEGRCVSVALTNLETSLMYAVKAYFLSLNS